RVLVKLVRTWFDTRPPAVADDDVEELAWQLARTALTAPACPYAGSGTWYEQIIARLYVSYAQAGHREEAREMWQNLSLAPRLHNRRGAALASIRLVQVITALPRCHSTGTTATPPSPASNDTTP